jgi:hypothetical protein
VLKCYSSPFASPYHTRKYILTYLANLLRYDTSPTKAIRASPLLSRVKDGENMGLIYASNEPSQDRSTRQLDIVSLPDNK